MPLLRVQEQLDLLGQPMLSTHQKQYHNKSWQEWNSLRMAFIIQLGREMQESEDTQE